MPRHKFSWANLPSERILDAQKVYLRLPCRRPLRSLLPHAGAPGTNRAHP